MNHVFRVFSYLLILATMAWGASSAYSEDMPDYKKAGLKGEYSKMARLLGPLVEEENPEAITLLGQLYYTGQGVELDAKRGIEMLIKGAHLGDELAQFLVSNEYIFGDVLPEDGPKALAWAEKSLAQGYTPAHTTVGKLYLYGFPGVEKDEEKGLKHLRLGAKAKDPVAHYILGLAYYNGWGVDMNKKQAALHFLDRSADYFHPAIYEVGKMVRDGVAFDQDKKLGWRFIMRAAMWGSDEAFKELTDAGLLPLDRDNLPKDFPEDIKEWALTCSGPGKEPPSPGGMPNREFMKELEFACR